MTSPREEPEFAQTTGPPRWVKVVAIIAGAVVVFFIVVMLTGGGEHGPSRHGGVGPAVESGEAAI